MCVNASTFILHTEINCPYTRITVPAQYLKKSPIMKKDAMFLFKFNAEEAISIPMIS